MSTKIRKYRILTPLFAVRDWFMHVTGLFDKKAKRRRKRELNNMRREDEQKRDMIRERIYALPNNYLHIADKQHLPIIVSTTTYGHRLSEYAPYALYSILMQNVLPDRIVINVNKDKWTDENLPEQMQQMVRLGVEVCYVDDIGPHTKLLPTLAQNPDKVIITVDDDVYYDEGMVTELYEAYEKSDKKTIFCRDGKAIKNENGKIMTYSANPHASKQTNTPYIIPFGVAGVLYPPQITFPKDMFDRELIAKLCPKADDVWFGLQELRADINVKYIPHNSWNMAVPVDRYNEFNEEGSSALHFSNDEHNLNDVQWEQVRGYYKM